MKRLHASKPVEREARSHEIGERIRMMLDRLERTRQSMLISNEMKSELYGGPQIFPELLTPEMERRVRDSLRIVNIEHAGAGRKKASETVALKVFDEIALLHGRGVLSDEQRFAAEKLQRDFHAARLDVAAIDYRVDKVDFGRREFHDDAMTERLDAIDRYVYAIRIVPAKCWPVVRDVVLGERKIDSVRIKGMRARKLKRLKIITLLETGLEELCRFYGFDERHKRKKHAKRLDNARPAASDFGSSAVVENENGEVD